MRKLLLLVILAISFTISAQEKFGYVNSGEVLMSMPEIADVEKQLADYNAQNTKYLQDMQKEFEDKLAKYQKDQATMSDAIRKVQEEELSNMQQRLQNTYQTLQQEAQTKQMQLIEPLQKRLKDAIEAIGKKNGYFMIFDVEQSGLLYKSDKATDITALVKKELTTPAAPAKK